MVRHFNELDTSMNIVISEDPESFVEFMKTKDKTEVVDPSQLPIAKALKAAAAAQALQDEAVEAARIARKEASKIQDDTDELRIIEEGHAKLVEILLRLREKDQ